MAVKKNTAAFQSGAAPSALPPTAALNYSYLPIDMTVRATPQALANFMQRLSDTDHIYTVDKFQIKKKLPEDANLDTDMSIHFFYRT